MFSIFVSVGSYHKVQPVLINLSKTLWLYDSQKRGETFSYVFIDTTFIKGRMYSSFWVGYQSIIFFWFFFPVKQQTLFITHLTVFFQLVHKRHHFKRMDIVTLHFPKAVHETDPHIYRIVNTFIPFFDMIQVSTHIEDKCRLTWISCPYTLMGCKEKVRTS